MAEVVRVTGLAIRSLRGRLTLLGVFTAVFLVAALSARAVAGHGEHIEPDALFRIGGFPLVSAMLLLGWTIGRFPVLATLVLSAGLFSADLVSGHARLLAVRPVSLAKVYGAKLLALALLASGVSALLLPAFDLILLGRWAGPATLVLIVAYVVAYGGLVAFLSTLTRADAWIALALGLCSILWAALRGAGALAGVPLVLRDLVTFLLPPQDAFFALEGAFANISPVPWGAFAYAVGYGLAFLALAGLMLSRREL